MISNRQGGRRRGRGGQRGQNLGGNRQDNRQRGNAAQLHEKYKNMARDAQLSGDRVQSEYYLQYAEHYFRMLENRPRFDDQRRQRGDDSSDDDDNDNENETEDESVEAQDEDRGERKQQQRSRGNGRDRSDRPDRQDRPDRNGAHKTQSQRDDEDERIALEVLPPAIGRESDDGEEAAPKPRRRARKPRADGDETEIAPAA